MLWKHDPTGKGMFTQLFRVPPNLCSQNWSGQKHEELEATATGEKKLGLNNRLSGDPELKLSIRFVERVTAITNG